MSQHHITPSLKGPWSTTVADRYVYLVFCVLTSLSNLQLYEHDPVRTLQLTTSIASALQEAERVCGGAHIFKLNYLDKTDPTVLKQLQTELAG